MSDRWLERLRQRKAVQEGHFLLTSGNHSSVYVQNALILQYPEDAAAIGRALAAQVRHLAPEVVLGPALGAVIVVHEVARALGTRGIFAERVDGRMRLRRGFALRPGERVLLVEDVITTGGSLAEVADVVREAGGRVVGAAAIVDRSGGTVALGVPLAALVTLDLPVFPPDGCPLCAQGLPVEKPGSRARPGARAG
ncbi:MAG: orotate phosphoribosyltransferase [Armatimonadota bacterium]|nr:orotate phosphoribosyltransferase [Armatimonadota bacterium]MDR7532444.1 orotate phosphoribosyltransferase [Armatimonadota bacterium]MDR7535667.1 orotate phosphoribosyltransferase [Armatimonadota bacterium]